MNDIILIIGRSPAARAVLPALLAAHHSTIVNVDDALAAMHVLERLRADYIIADAEAAPMAAEAFAAARRHAPHLADAPIRTLRASETRVPADVLLSRALSAWKDEAVPSNDLRIVLPAMLSCLERAI